MKLESPQRTFTTDWLNTNPVFYNEKTGKASHSINNVIEDIEIHPEGLYNYVDFGYSVFGQTPIKDVKFLPPNSTFNNGKITHHSDPAENTVRGDVFELIESKVKFFERTVKETILPLSGGYDSRMLACMVNPSRTFAFTYGISPHQHRSFEVARAKEVCQRLGIPWRRIPLGDFHDYIEDWIRWYGCSVHAHGMYHIEFFRKIKAPIGTGLLSGIGGDLLSNEREPIAVTPHNLRDLGYTHGMHGDVSQLKFKPESELREEYLRVNAHKLKDIKLQTIETIRMKSLAISYLLTLPHKMGYKTYSPYVDPQVAMLMLSRDRRKGREWVVELFKRRGVDIAVKGSRMNTLDFQAVCRGRLNYLKVDVLSEYFNPKYVEWINKKILHISQLRRYYYLALKTPYLKEGLKRVGLRENITKAYFAYLTLLPIQRLLECRK